MNKMVGGEPIEAEVLRTAFILCAVFAFIFGISIGSFLNVCIYRFPLYGRSPWKPTFSFCFTCGTTLQLIDNLPLISYLMLMGRCRRCGAVYSSRYFWIELFCGLMFLGLFLHFGTSLAFLVSAVLGAQLIVIVFTDLDEYIIPDEISLGGIGIGLLLSVLVWLVGDSPLTSGLPVKTPIDALLGAVAGGGILWLIGFVATTLLRREAMGMGDVKLLGMMGTFIGATNILLTIFLASCLGAIFGLAFRLVQAARGHRTYDRIPFGPYLAVAGFATLFIGPWLLDYMFPPGSWDILKESIWGQ